MRLRLHSLEAVAPLPPVPGELREARPDERELVLEWWSAFAAEAGAHDDRAEHERGVDARMATPLGMVVWAVDGRPVCVAGSTPSPPAAARIGPVYTPPDLRRNGYGTALTAELTRRLLAGGCDRCMLYTDLANPTSNAIYTRIGYRPVCDSVEIAFEPPA
jgi:predicted GNAT family acetyltransferase